MMADVQPTKLMEPPNDPRHIKARGNKLSSVNRRQILVHTCCSVWLTSSNWICPVVVGS